MEEGLKYLVWYTEHFDGVGLSLQEPAVYQYLEHLETNAGATMSASFREGVCFCKHIVGLESADIVLDSRRLAGAAPRHFSTKCLLSQAPVLSVDDVKELESKVSFSSCKMDS